MASALWVFFHLLSLDVSPWRGLSCHVVSSSVERPMWQETDSSYEQPVRTWGLPKDKWVSLEVDSSLAEFWDDCTLSPTPRPQYQVRGTQISCARLLTYRNCGKTEVCCVKLLNLGMVYYIAEVIWHVNFLKSLLFSYHLWVSWAVLLNWASSFYHHWTFSCIWDKLVYLMVTESS